MRITLPGSETVTLTGQTIDKLIRAGDGDAALLYLYILKTRGQSTSSEAAAALNKGKGWVASAMAVLSRLGLVQLDDNAGTGAHSAEASPASEEPLKEPRQHTLKEVTDEVFKGSEFTVVVDETQRRLGRHLSSDELLRLFGMYDNLRLPAEVILQLITHCINESRVTGDGRAPSIRYIEKAAYTWEREGIFSLEKAEEYLKNLEVKKGARGEIKRALQIKGREFSATEKRYVDDWINMGFEPGAIEIAYDRAVVNTGNPAIAYIDGIVKNWHRKGLHTVEQVLDKDSAVNKKTASAGANLSGQKHGIPNQQEMERMTRILNKIKEE